jgi:hypothetical protein
MGGGVDPYGEIHSSSQPAVRHSQYSVIDFRIGHRIFNSGSQSNGYGF